MLGVPVYIVHVTSTRRPLEVVALARARDNGSIGEVLAGTFWSMTASIANPTSHSAAAAVACAPPFRARATGGAVAGAAVGQSANDRDRPLLVLRRTESDGAGDCQNPQRHGRGRRPDVGDLDAWGWDGRLTPTEFVAVTCTSGENFQSLSAQGVRRGRARSATSSWDPAAEKILSAIKTLLQGRFQDFFQGVKGAARAPKAYTISQGRVVYAHGDRPGAQTGRRLLRQASGFRGEFRRRGQARGGDGGGAGWSGGERGRRGA